MNYHKADSKVPKNITVKVSSLTIATLLITSIFLGVIPITPAYADANATISSSGAKAPWHITPEFLIQIRIVEPDLTGNLIPDIVTLTLVQKDGVGATVDTDNTVIAVEAADSGEFHLFLRGNGGAIVPGNPPLGFSIYDVGSNVPVVVGGSIIISYLDASGPVTISTTITISTTSATMSSDRTIYPPDGILHLTVMDQDLNADPTSMQTIPSITLTLSALLANGTTKTGSLVAAFTETDVNSKTFTNTNALLLGTDYTTALGITSFMPNDLLTIFYNDPIGGGTAVVNIEFMLENGILLVSPTFTYNSELAVQAIDFDRNKDTMVKDTTISNNAIVEVLNSTNAVVDWERGDLTETATNSSTFLKMFMVTWNFDFTAGATPNNSLLEIMCGQRVKVYYFDPSAGTNTSQIYSVLSCVAPSIAPDLSTVGPGGQVQLTLVDPNANDNSLVRETIVSSEGGDVNLEAGDSLGAVQLDSSNKAVAEMRFRVQKGGAGLFNTASALATFSIVFRETAANSGVYVLTTKLDTAKISDGLGGALASGDILEIRFKDLISGQSSTVTILISAIGAVVSLDRAIYPVADGIVKIHVTITDPDANTNNNIVENVILGDDETPTINRISGATLYNLVTAGNIKLEETTPSSGVFKATLIVDQKTIESSRAWINAQLLMPYKDASLGITVTATASFRLNDVSISVDKSSVSYGQSFTVTITDNDNNLDSLAYDIVMYTLSYTSLGGASTTENLYAVETGANTGTFVDVLVVGTDFSPKIGNIIMASFTDDTPITAAPTDQNLPWPAPKTVTAILSTSTQTGELTISPWPEFGPGTKVNITIFDFDLNTNIFAKETVQISIKTNTVPNGMQFMLTETGLSTGIFNTKLQIGGTGASIAASVGDLVQIVYIDASDASGNAKSIIRSARVISEDPTMSYTKPYYNPGQVVTLNILDFDANLDPDLPDSVPVIFSSDSDPIGLALTAWEMEVNSGNFTVSFTIMSTYLPNTLFVAVGDTITAVYRDLAPASFPTTLLPKTFKANVTVGIELPPIQRVPASTPTTVDSMGNPVTTPTVGTVTIIQAQVCNNDSRSHTFAFIVQIKNANGVVVAINWIQDFTLAAGACAIPGVSWTPDSRGTYTIQVFVWESLANPIALSPVFSQTVTVV